MEQHKHFMKKLFFKSALVLTMLNAFLGCSGDSDSAPIECPLGYGGSDC